MSASQEFERGEVRREGGPEEIYILCSAVGGQASRVAARRRPWWASEIKLGDSRTESPDAFFLHDPKHSLDSRERLGHICSLDPGPAYSFGDMKYISEQ